MLKHKKHNSQLEWIRAFNEQKEFAETPKGIELAENLIDIAVKRIPEGNSIYGWSGGKDALALQCVCEVAGITDCVLGTIGFEWEYPEFVDYINKNKPHNLVIKSMDVTSQFLNEHDNLVFPESSRDVYRWAVMYNQSSYYTYAREMCADNIILGHRVQDGNVVRKGRISQKIFPMWDFTHEDVFLILCYGKKTLAPIYYYPSGFYEGTHAWIERPGGEAAMEDVYCIDRTLLEHHRDVVKIDEFLNKKENL